MIREDKWADLEHTVFKAIRDELCVIDQIVMKGSRIVLPQKMQKRGTPRCSTYQGQTERERMVAQNGQRR